MLIRSQNNKVLFNLYIVLAIGVERGGSDITISTNENVITIGSYSTEKKAIKVLDMIQEYYEKYKTAHSEVFWNAFCYPKVFVMPQDEEVML